MDFSQLLLGEQATFYIDAARRASCLKCMTRVHGNKIRKKIFCKFGVPCACLLEFHVHACLQVIVITTKHHSGPLKHNLISMCILCQFLLHNDGITCFLW